MFKSGRVPQGYQSLFGWRLTHPLSAYFGERGDPTRFSLVKKGQSIHYAYNGNLMGSLTRKNWLRTCCCYLANSFTELNARFYLFFCIGVFFKFHFCRIQTQTQTRWHSYEYETMRLDIVDIWQHFLDQDSCYCSLRPGFLCDVDLLFKCQTMAIVHR